MVWSRKIMKRFENKADEMKLIYDIEYYLTDNFKV